MPKKENNDTTTAEENNNNNNNIFETNVLFEIIIEDLERLEERIDLLQKQQALLRKDLVKSGVLVLI